MVEKIKLWPRKPVILSKPLVSVMSEINLPLFPINLLFT